MTQSQWDALLDATPGDTELRIAYACWLQDECDEFEEAEFQRWLGTQETLLQYCFRDFDRRFVRSEIPGARRGYDRYCRQKWRHFTEFRAAWLLLNKPA